MLWLEPEFLVLIAYEQKPFLSESPNKPSIARCLHFGLRLYLYTLCTLAATVLSLHICKCSPEPFLLENAMNVKYLMLAHLNVEILESFVLSLNLYNKCIS